MSARRIRRRSRPDVATFRLMRLHVVHETRYTYSSPVALSHQLLHLTPRALPWQSCEEYRIRIDPAPGEMTERRDYYGNPTLHALIAVPHEALLVRAESRLDVKPRAQAALAAPRVAWEEVRSSLNALNGPPLEPAEFLYDSLHVQRTHELAHYASKSFTRGRGIVEAAVDLARRVHKEFRFDPAAT